MAFIVLISFLHSVTSYIFIFTSLIIYIDDYWSSVACGIFHNIQADLDCHFMTI